MTATTNLAPAAPGATAGHPAGDRRSARPTTAPSDPTVFGTAAFRRLAAPAAVITALTSVAYTVTFAVVVRRGSTWAQWASSSVLLAGSLLSLLVLVGIAAAVARRAELELAIVAGLLGAAGALGAATHAAFDLANLANPPAGANDAASHVDPRGFATFALTGLAMAMAACLGRRAGLWHARLAGLGVATGATLIVIFIGRLTLLDPNSALIAPFAVAAGLVLNPLWLLGLARAYRAGGPRHA
jgi:hypothetical protein